MQYRVLIEQDEDGVYVAEVPTLPGCIAQGTTRVEVIANIREAMSAYLESLQAHSEPVLPSGISLARTAVAKEQDDVWIWQKSVA